MVRVQPPRIPIVPEKPSGPGALLGANEEAAQGHSPQEAAAAGSGKRRRVDVPTEILERLKALETEVKRIGTVMSASVVGQAAGALNALNERQSYKGLARLRADLEAMQMRGILDEDGNRISNNLPEGLSDNCDV